MQDNLFIPSTPARRNPGRSLLVALFMLLGLTAEAQAQTARDLWLSMPDSLVSLLTAAQRADMVDADNLRLGVKTTNQLGGQSEVDTLTANCLSATLTASSTLQLGVLPRTDGDTLVCLVRTYKGPQSESTVTFYTASWQTAGSLSFRLDDFVQRPDTMTQDRYREVLSSLDPYFFSAELSLDARTLTVTPHAAALGADEQKAAEAIFLKRKYNWDGNKFN